MARTQDTETQAGFTPVAAPPFTVPFRDWAETKLPYPREVYKGEYYRMTGGQEDHFKLLRDGWVDDLPAGHPYKPWTASPEAQALAKRGLAWYLGLAPTYTTIYGAFAAVPILLSWIYLGWVIVLLGAVIAAYAPSLQMRVVRHAVTPGWRFMLALTVLRELALARQSTVRGVALVELCERLRLDPLQVDPVVEQLQRLDWVGSLSEPGLARHVLLIDPACTPVAPLVQALLLSARWQDEAFWRHAGLTEMRLSDALGRETSS